MTFVQYVGFGLPTPLGHVGFRPQVAVKVMTLVQ
jgi:hypothetical protein